MSVVLGSAAVQLVTDDSQFRKGLQSAETEAHGFASRVSGALARIGEIAAGTLIGNVLPKLTAGFAGLAKEGLTAVADYERLGQSLESLVAKELRKASVETETHVVGQRRVELTAQETEKLKDLGMQRDLMAAKLQEESERHRQLVNQWGEEGLAVKTHAASMAILQDKYNETGAAIAGLEGKQGKLVTVTETTSKQTLSMADALAQAGPKAKELIRWIELLAVKSPFTQEDVAGAFRMAQAYGFVSDSADKNVVSAKRLTTSLIDFTSATGATGPTMERIALALGQVQAKGKLAGQEVMQLTEAGISVDAILANAFGKSTSEIVAMREKGLIPADQAILAIVQSLEQDFGGAAARSAGTFAGLISTMSDVKTIGLREFFTGAFEAAKPLLEGLTNTLTSDAFMAKLTAMGTALGGFVTTMITKGQELIAAFQTGGFGGVLTALGISPEIAALLQNFTNGLASVGQMVTGTVLPALSNLASQVMPAIQSALQFVNEHWEAFRGALIGIAAVLAGAALAGAIAGVAGALVALVNPVTVLIGLAAALGAAWATNFGGIQDKVASAWAVIEPIFDKLKESIGRAIEAFTNLRDSGESISTSLMGAFVSLATQFGVFEEFKTLVVSVREGWAMLVEFFTPTIERLKESFGQMIASFEPIGGKLQELWTAAEPVLKTLATIIGTVVVGAFNLLLEVVAAVMPSVGGIIGNAIDAATALFQFIGTVIQEVVTLVKAVFEGDWATVWASAGIIVSTFVETIKTLLGLIWDSFSTIFGNLVTAVGNWIGNINTEAGQRFQAFVDGVKEKFADVYEKVKTGMGQAVDYIRKIDLAEIGRNLITSLANALWSRATTYLREKAQGIASLLPEWVKKLLGIASPSRVFYEIGLNIITGMVEGMEYRTPEALEAMANVLGSIGDILDGMFKLGSATIIAEGWADKLRGLTQQMQELYVIFNEFAAWSFNNGNVMEGLADVGGQMSSVTGGIIDTIDAMAALGSWKAIEDVPGKLRSLMDAIRQTVIALAGLADQQGIEEAASISAPLVVAAQGIGDIAAAWQKVGSFVQGTLDVDSVTRWLAGFANMAVNALTAAQANAATLPEKFADFVASLRLSVGTLADLAKAWDTVSSFQWQDKTWSVAAVMDFLTAFGGMAAQFVTSLNSWSGLDVKTAVVAQVRTAVQLIADIAGAWANIREFKWLPKEADVTGIQQFLVAFGGFAARFVTALNSWSGFDVKTAVVAQVRMAVQLLGDIASAWEKVTGFAFDKQTVNMPAIGKWLARFGGFAAQFVSWLNSWPNIDVKTAIVAQVRAAVQLIADIAAAWEKVQTFKGKPKDMDVSKVISWLASFGGQVTSAFAEVSKWKQFAGLGEKFLAFLDAFKAVMAAASEALKFATELSAWKDAKDLPERFLRLRNDFETIILYVFQMRQHVGDMVTGDLVKFVRYVGELSDGLISAVKLMAELENLRRFDMTAGIEALAAMIDAFLDGLETIIAGMTTKQAELVTAFGAALNALMQGLQAALQLALAVPRTWAAPDVNIWNDFTLWVQRVFTTFYDWVNNTGQYAGQPVKFGEAGMTLMVAFSTALSGLMGALKVALELALDVPAKWAAPDVNIWNDFTLFVQRTFKTFYDWINRTGQYHGQPVLFGKEGMDLMVAFSTALGALMGALKTALDLALAVPNQWVAPNQEQWGRFITWVQGVFSTFVTYVKNNFPEDSEEAKQFPAVQAFGQAMGAVFQGLGAALDVFQRLTTYLPILNSRIDTFLDNVKYAYGEIQKFATGEGVQAGTAATTAFATAASAVFNALGAALQVFGQLVEGTNTPIDTFKTRLQSLIQRISITLGAWKTYVQTEAAGNWVPNSTAFVNTLNAVLDTLKKGLDLFVALNQNGLPSPSQITAFVNSILALFAQLTAGIGATPAKLDTAGQGIKTELSSWPAEWVILSNAYGTFGQNLAAQLSYSFQQQMTNMAAGWAGGRILAAMQTLLATLTTGQNTPWANLGYALGGQLVNGLISAFGNTYLRSTLYNSLAYPVTGSLSTYILATFGGSFVTTGYWLGSNIAYGLADGLRNAAAMIKITDSVTVVIDAIKNAIKVAFNIKSPSRVTAGYGEQIAAGLALGITSGVSQVERAGDMLAQAVGPFLGTPAGANYSLATEKRIIVEFTGQAGGGVPMTPQQFDALTRQLAYAIRVGA